MIIEWVCPETFDVKWISSAKTFYKTMANVIVLWHGAYTRMLCHGAYTLKVLKQTQFQKPNTGILSTNTWGKGWQGVRKYVRLHVVGLCCFQAQTIHSILRNSAPILLSNCSDGNWKICGTSGGRACPFSSSNYSSMAS